jgi:hypothetical protein
MKKFLFLSILLVCGLSVNAQVYRVLSYEFKNDMMIVRTGPNNFVHFRANISNVYFAPFSTQNIFVYSDRALTNLIYTRIFYSGTQNGDTIFGYTRDQAVDLLNQAVNAKKGNYLGNYQKTGLFVPDTATVGYYYYDKDSALFRVRTQASGWQSLQPKN